MKVMTIVGTRPEIIKLSLTMMEIDKYFDHVIVHTGQNYDYELNEIFFKEFGLRKPDYFLNTAGVNVAETIGNIIVKSDQVMEKEKPDAVLLYGDTNSCLSVISAKRRKIPVFHMEAGNRCFDQRVPEEINRKVVDHLSDINLVLTEHARNYLLAEGVRAETIIKTGSSMKEILKKYEKKIYESDILQQLALQRGEYFVFSSHREENVDNESNLRKIIAVLNVLTEVYKVPVIFSTHPRTRKNLQKIDTVVNSNVQFSKPFGFFDYISLQLNAKCVLSDSGTITEESSLLGFPAVTIRDVHERPEGMDEATVIMCGLELRRVIDSVDMVIKQHSRAPLKVVKDYNVDNVSVKVTRIILSYTEYINQKVWFNAKG